MQVHEVVFQCKDYEIVGALNRGMACGPIVVMCTGLFRNFNESKYERLQDELEKKDIASFRFDLYACSPKQREKIERCVASVGLTNLTSAVGYLEKLGYQRKGVGIVGSSTGGDIAASYASSCEVGALVLREPTWESVGNKIKQIKSPTLIIHGNILKRKLPELSEINGSEIAGLDFNEQLNYFSIADAKQKLRDFGGIGELKFIQGANHGCEIPEHVEKFVEYSVDWFARWLNV